MLKHEILTIFRTLKKSKVISSLSIFGLAAGLTVVFLAGRYVYTEKTFDRFHENHHSIYRIEAFSSEYGSTCYSPNIMASWLKETIPDIKGVTRIINDGGSGLVRNLTYNSIKYNIDKPLIIDPDFLSIFSFRVVSGEMESFKRDKYSLALNKSLADRIFGDEDPIGKILAYKGESFTVRGIIEDPPPNSSIRFDMLLPIANIPDYADDAIWTNRTLQIFILAEDGIQLPPLQEKIQSGVLAAVEPLGISQHVNTWQIRLNPLKAVYYSGYSNDGICIHGNSKLTFLILSMALVVLIIALINHLNASLVKTFEKNKELGIRKVIGASAADNTRLLILELSAPCLIAFILALQFSTLLESVINPLLNVPLLEIGILEYAVLTAGCLLLGILSSLFPALQSSRFSITDSLKGKSLTGKRASVFKGSLSVVQFTASIVLIFSLIVIYKQLNYSMKEGSSNFDKDMVLYMPLSDRSPEKDRKIYTIQESLKSLSEVDEASSCLHLPGDESYSFLEIALKVKGREESWVQVNHNMVDLHYPEVMGYKIARGRSFSPELESDYGSYIVNETFADRYNIRDLSEAELNGSPIVGVMKDIHYNSLHKGIEPLAVRYFNSYQSRIVIRLASPSDHSFSEISTKIKGKIEAIDATAVSDILFLNGHIAALYEKENRLFAILFLLAVFSILISCMGLFSMSLYAAKSRTKEIGIRKVVGAGMSDLMMLLNREFLKWVAAAFVFAVPAGWYAMDRWLNNFAYKTTIDWWIFMLAGIIAMSVALLTVSGHAWRTAARNPVEALREE